MIKTAIRVNPREYDANCLGIDSDIKEIYIKNVNQKSQEHQFDSWIVDEVYEIQNSHNPLPIFATQSDVYQQIENWISTSNSSLLYCIIVGGKATGKTFTLYGENSLETQGILPRYIRSLFNSEKNTLFVQISMYLSYADHFIDLLNPPAKHPYTNNVGYTPSTGVFIIPLKSILSSTLDHALHTLHLGLMSAAMISLNSHDLMNSCHLITSCRVITSERAYHLTFIEISSIIFYPSCLTESDRLSSSCLQVNCANSLAFCGLFGESSKEDINGFNNKSNQSLRKSMNIAGPYETSFLTYLLQDALALRSSAHLTESPKTSTYLLGCVKSSLDCLSDTKVSLDFIHAISERINSIQRETVSIQQQDSNEELTTVPVNSKSYKQITDIIDEVNIEIDKLSRLLEDLEEEKQLLGPSQSSSSFQSQLTSLESLKSFNERKLSHLAAYKDVLARSYHFRNNFSDITIDDLSSIQKWLKFRGLLGLKYLSSPTGENDARDKRQKNRNPSSADETDYIPWITQCAPISEPYFRPITSLNICRDYLHIPIPAGHMAFCFESLREGVAQESVKFAFPGIKHCKILKIDGYLIRPKHCIIFRLGSTIKIRPLPNDDEEVVIVRVNGREISEETKLYHLDTITLGLDTIFVIHIPVNVDELQETKEEFPVLQNTSLKESNTDLNQEYSPSMVVSNIIAEPQFLSINNWCHAIVSGIQGDLLSFTSTHLMNINHYNHSALDRQLIPILKLSELTHDMKLSQYAPPMSLVQKTLSTVSTSQLCVLTELHLAVKQLNFYANELRRLVSYEVVLTKSQNKQSSLLLRQYCGIEDGINFGGESFSLQVRCEVLDGNRKSGKGDSWLWSSIIFLQRYFQIQKMYFDYHEKYDSNLELLDESYPPEVDPFYDPSLPELIGVSTLHIDSLYHLIDTRDTLPIITFKGNHGGQLKLHVRIWIDKVETVPSYITVDRESKLIDFMGRTAIIRFYFEYLLDIPPALSNDLQVIFSFFGHTGQYRTTRSPAMNIISGDKHAYINSIIVIEQKITPDFVRYIQKKSIEFEVWGTRLSNRQYVAASHMIGKLTRIGEPVRMKKRGRKINIESKSEFANTELHPSDDDEPDTPETEDEKRDDKGDEDPAELKNKLKEMAFQLEKAEKNMRRTTKAAATYRDELSRVNSTSILKDQTITTIAAEKDSKIRELEDKLRQLKDEADKERQLRIAIEEKNKIKPSKICIIS